MTRTAFQPGPADDHYHDTLGADEHTPSEGGTPTLAEVLSFGSSVGDGAHNPTFTVDPDVGGTGAAIFLAPTVLNGGALGLYGGDGVAGKPGGDVILRSGTGDDSNDVSAAVEVSAGGDDGIGTPGYVAIKTLGSYGTAGQVFTSDGSFHNAWTTLTLAEVLAGGSDAGQDANIHITFLSSRDPSGIFVSGGQASDGSDGAPAFLSSGASSDNDGGAGGAYVQASGGQSNGNGGQLQLNGGTSAPGGGNAAGGDVVVILPAGAGAGRQGLLRIVSLPTADPSVPDALWNDAGTLKVSAG